MKRFRTNTAASILSILGIALLLWGCASQAAKDTTASAQPEETRPAALLSVEASDIGDTTYVTIASDKALAFSALKQPDPLAVVLYFPETTVSKLPAAQAVAGSSVVKEVLTRDGARSGTARVEIRLLEDIPYTAQKEGNTISLAFDRSQAAYKASSDAPETASTSAPSKMAESSQPQATDIENTAEAVPIRKSTSVSSNQGTAWVNKIDFLSEANGKSTVVVGTTHPVDYNLKKVSPQKIELHLLNTKIPSYRQRPLITTRFTSAVDRVVPYQVSKQGRQTVVSIEMREAVPYFSEQVENMLLVHFEASNVPPKPMEQANLPAWKQAMADTSLASEPASTMQQPVIPAAADTAAAPSGVAANAVAKNDDRMLENQIYEDDIELRTLLAPRRRNYNGEKIALDFYDTDIKNVFRILREVSGKNFAIDKDVTGKVTMTLDKPVPWDQVLDLVLRMNQLGMTHEGDIIRIATVETLKQEDDLKKAKLEAVRKAREEAKALEPLVTRYFPVSYANADSDIKPHIEQILTKDRGSVTVDAKNNQIILTDTAKKVKQAGDIIRRIDKVTAQVLIEARVVEVNNTFSKELGIDWKGAHGPGLIPGTSWKSKTEMAMNFPSASTSSIGINFSRLSGVPFVLNAKLNAVETTGEGRILSSPKILTLDNKKAKIKQGLEFGYLERDSSGGSSTKFKNVDLLLEVTPHVTPDNRISLTIFLTKNDIDAIINGVPSVATNEAETELLINDGDTVVIGGIIKKTSNKDESGFPVLNKIPILGWLFKKNTDKTSDKELLIFITPRIVQLEQVAGSFNGNN